MTDNKPLILVVEDEADLTDLYATWLQMEYRVRTAYGGEEALEQLDGEVDVMLLDRRMPTFSGDEVIEEVQERDIDCRISMMSAVEPDTDIIDMAFDTYLTKPVTRDEVEATVEELLTLNTYDERVQYLHSLSAKKEILETIQSEAALKSNQQYQELCAEIDDLSAELDATVESFEHTEA